MSHYSTQKGVFQKLNITNTLCIKFYSTEIGIVQKTEYHVHIVYHIFYTERGCPQNWTTQTDYISNIILHRKGWSRKLNITYILYIRYYSTKKMFVQKTKHHIYCICLILFYFILYLCVKFKIAKRLLVYCLPRDFF